MILKQATALLWLTSDTKVIKSRVPQDYLAFVEWWEVAGAGDDCDNHVRR